MKNKKKFNDKRFLFLILFLFSTSLISLKTLKKVSIYDVRIFGTKYISQDDLEKIKKSNLEAIKYSFASEKIKSKLRNIIESSY